VDKDITGYVAAARKHGEATEVGDSVAANKAFRELDRCWEKIRMTDADWRPSFLLLLADANPWVRLWAASHAIHIDASCAVSVLEVLALEPGLLGFTAQMTLETWEKGALGERN
jgi:hypothetical protein